MRDEDDRRALHREQSFQWFAPQWQKTLRVCVTLDHASGKNLLHGPTVKLWLDYLEQELERIEIMCDLAEDDDAQLAVLELSETYIRLEEAWQVRKRRASGLVHNRARYRRGTRR